MNYLSEYQTFDSTQELNHHVKQHTNRNRYDMNETDRNILQFISQYSIKYSGACHLKAFTIAEGIGKSRRTVERSVKKLIRLNVIDRINTTRAKSGGKGANIYRILPYDVASEVSHCTDSEKVTESKEYAPIPRNETAILLSKKNYILETAKATKNAIPAPIYETLAPFFNAKELRKLTGVIFRGKTNKVRIEAHAEAFTDVLTDCIRRYKAGAVRNLDGYIYASVRKLSRRLYVGGAA